MPASGQVDERGVCHAHHPFEQVGGPEDLHQHTDGKHPPERQEREHRGVDELADHGGGVVAQPDELKVRKPFPPEIIGPHIMELGNQVGQEAGRRDPGHEPENHGQAVLGKIIRGRGEKQGQVHEHGHGCQGKQPDEHGFFGLVFAVHLGKDIRNQKRGRIHDVA